MGLAHRLRAHPRPGDPGRLTVDIVGAGEEGTRCAQDFPARGGQREHVPGRLLRRQPVLDLDQPDPEPGPDPAGPTDLEFTEIPIGDLPLYSPDFDADYPPEARALKEADRRASTPSSSSRRSTTAPSRAP